MRRVFQHRDARIYLAGRTLSLIGDNSLWLAMAIWVKIITGSNGAAGLTFFAYLAGLVLAPIGGLVADRFRRRPLLLIANLVTGTAVGTLLFVHGRGQLWLIYLVLFVYGAADGLMESAQTALLAVMLPDDLLGDVNSLMVIAEQGLRIATPLIGAGLLVWVGAKPVILLDTATFAGTAVCLIALRIREPRPTRSTTSWYEELTAGIRHIRNTDALRKYMISVAGAVLVFGFFRTVPFAVVGQGLHRSPAFLGILESLLGGGAVIGGLLAAPIMRRVSEGGLVASSMTAGALGCLMLTISWLPTVLIGMALVGACFVWVDTAHYTVIQRHSESHLVGRVNAAVTMMAMIPQVISTAVGAALIAVVNYRLLLAVMAAAFIIPSLAMAVFPNSGTDGKPDTAQSLETDFSRVPEGPD
jgi:MFS family permease